MNRRWVLIFLCVAVSVALLTRAFWPTGGVQSPIPLDDEAVADLGRFVSELDAAPSEDVRVALGLLPRFQPDRFGEIYKAVIERSQKTPVREAAFVSWRKTGELDIETVTGVLRNDAEPSLRIQAAREVARQKAWKAVPKLLEAMEKDDQPRVRLVAQQSTGKILGIEFDFDPAAGEAERKAVAKRYHDYWAAMEWYHKAEERLNEKAKS